MTEIRMGVDDDYCQGEAEHVYVDDDAYELPAEDKKPKSIRVARGK